MKRYIGLIGLAVVLSCAAMSLPAAGQSGWNFTVPAAEVKPVNGVFVFDAASFQDGKARHFMYKHSPGEWIRFFVVKSQDGVIRAAFDACEVCYRNKKGYVQQGDQMVCIHCGLKFHTNKINEVRGGCNPSPLTRTLQRDKVVITQQDAMTGLRFFQ